MNTLERARHGTSPQRASLPLRPDPARFGLIPMPVQPPLPQLAGRWIEVNPDAGEPE